MIVSRSFLAAPREGGLCGFVGVDVSYGHPRPSFAERSRSAARGNGSPKSLRLFASPLHCGVRGGGRRGGAIHHHDERESTSAKGSHASGDRPPIEAANRTDEHSADTPGDADRKCPLPAPRRCISTLGHTEKAIYCGKRQSAPTRHNLDLKCVTC